MAEYKNIINNKVVISGEAELNKVKKEFIATKEQLDRVNAALQQTQSELERTQSQFDNFANHNGINILQAELERFKNTAQQSVVEFKSFLNSVNLNDVDGYTDYEFERLFEQIRDGSLTASQAILQVKTNFRALMEENYNKSGGLFDSQVVQQFSASLEKLGETMDIVLQKINTIEQDGVKSTGGAGGGDISSVLNQIENAAHGMSEEIKDSYASITSLVEAMNGYANLDSTKLLGVSQAFRNIADIGKGSYGTKAIENIVYLTKQLQTLSDGTSSIRFDFTGLNDLKVSKASMSNLATYLPQIADINISKLEKLSKIDFSNLNNIKVSKSSIESIAHLTEALQVLKETKVLNINTNDESTHITSSDKADNAASHYKDAAKAIKEYYSLLLQIDKSKSDVSLTANGWKSKSGDWYELAEALNRAQIAFDLYTNAENQSNLSSEDRIKILKFLTTEYQKFNLAAEVQLNKERQQEQSVYSLTAAYNTLTQMRTLIDNNTDYSNLESYEKLKTLVTVLDEAIRATEKDSTTLSLSLQNTGENGSNAITEAKTAMAAFKEEMSRSAAAQKTMDKKTEQYNSTLVKLNKLLIQLRSNAEKWSAAKNGESSIAYGDYTRQIKALETLINDLNSGRLTHQGVEERFSAIKSAVSDSEKSIRAAGEATQSWSQRVGKLSEKFNTWFGLTRFIMGVYRGIRQMVTSVIELDTAMTELKKVTDETDKRYEKFLSNAATRAKQLGATLTDTVSATADFARLGYSLDAAEKLADAAILYKNVGDGISDINTASESIIATMQAFGIGAEDVIKIVDKFNAVGNNYAISSKGVGDALLRSAAAMEAANNSLDETIALAAAANTIIQDSDKVGTTLKTISMYLRAAKTEAEEAGEATDGMANSVSELREEILSLTGNKVDIQIDNDTFKSTYQILKELSGVWSKLTDVSQANILELIGGKRNSNVVAALLKNFSIAENAVTTSAESAGSALAENEKYLDSINGKIAQFEAAFQTLSQDTVDNDFVKFIVDIGTGLVNILDGLQKINLLLPSIIGIAAAAGLEKKNVGRPKMFGLFEHADSNKCSYGYISFLNAEYGTYIFVNEA